MKVDILSVVTQKAAELSELQQTEIRPEHWLLRDIRMDEDDFSYIFVPQLERLLGVKTRPSDWDAVYTVRDVVELFERKLSGTAPT